MGLESKDYIPFFKSLKPYRKLLFLELYQMQSMKMYTLESPLWFFVLKHLQMSYVKLMEVSTYMSPQ